MFYFLFIVRQDRSPDLHKDILCSSTIVTIAYFHVSVGFEGNMEKIELHFPETTDFGLSWSNKYMLYSEGIERKQQPSLAERERWQETEEGKQNGNGMGTLLFPTSMSNSSSWMLALLTYHGPPDPQQDT